MSDQQIQLTRRRLLGGLVTIGSASVAAGAGTMAYFSDTESSADNAVQAGTLDLTLDDTDQTVTFLDESGIAPGDSGQGSVSLGNAGTIPGTPEVEVAAIRSTENGYYGKENGQDGSPNDGELDEHLEVRVSFDGQTIVGRTTVANVSPGDSYTMSSTIGAGESKPFTVEWWLPSDTSNLAQSDGYEFDLTFRLVQDGGS